MEEIKSYQHGEFCWIELATGNSENSKKFYKELFGWGFVDHQMDENNTYTMFQMEGKDIAACYNLCSDLKEMGVPPHWGNYIAVNSVDEIVKKVKSTDGKIINEPMDIPEAGRMAIIEDPTGAVFGIWEAKQHIGSRFKNQFNTFCWNELATNNVDKCKDFYKSVFGYDSFDQTFGEMDYTTFKLGEIPVGGMYKLSGEMENIPSHWLVYFSVENCDKTVEKAISLGAEVVVPAMEIEGVGKFAVLKGTENEHFGVITLT